MARDRAKEENEKRAFGLEIVREGRPMADLEGLSTYRRFFIAGGILKGLLEKLGTF